MLQSASLRAVASKHLKNKRMMCIRYQAEGLTKSPVNSLHKNAFRQEIASARSFIRERRFEEAFIHLQRAHVLGQERVSSHVLSRHLLGLAFRRREPKAALGQIVRIVLGALGSAAGSVPTGNTGGSDVSMFKRMPIDPELLSIMQGRKPDNLAKADGSNDA